MSTQYVHTSLRRMGSAPSQAANLRTVAMDRLARFGRAIWRALEAQGTRRADRELLARAEACRESNPTLSRELRSYVRGGSTY